MKSSAECLAERRTEKRKLDAIRAAKHSILFESYLWEDDPVGREFAEALAERARSGVRVYVVYDWLGSFWAGALWTTLAAAGAHVRAFNPLRFDSPLGWLTRDHRKTIAIDGRVFHRIEVANGDVFSLHLRLPAPSTRARRPRRMDIITHPPCPRSMNPRW